ncbi:MAG TPA: ABC transporter ATP-binding protein [Anaerolineae bacterium]
MLLKLERVTKSFGGVMAVRAVDLTVAEGEILGLIGPNGAGKTTLFNLITGFYRTDRGSVFFQEKDITRLGPADRCKRGIARTFQLVRPFQNMTLGENVAVGCIYGRVPAPSRRKAEDQAREILDLVGLADQFDAPAHNLTLMNRKRLELARALATRPYLLLLDEFLAGLNPSEVHSAMELVQRLRASKTAIILVEHLVEAVFGISDRVMVLNVGEKIAEGSPVAVASDERVIDAYLGHGLHAHA